MKLSAISRAIRRNSQSGIRANKRSIGSYLGPTVGKTELAKALGENLLTTNQLSSILLYEYMENVLVVSTEPSVAFRVKKGKESDRETQPTYSVLYLTKKPIRIFSMSLCLMMVY